jgi:hypothetical protein
VPGRPACQNVRVTDDGGPGPGWLVLRSNSRESPQRIENPRRLVKSSTDIILTFLLKYATNQPTWTPVFSRACAARNGAGCNSVWTGIRASGSLDRLSGCPDYETAHG